MLESRKQIVLVVDDTPENLLMMSSLLHRQYRVKVSSNGTDALKIAHSDTPPDLILLDVMMPGMDGYAVCRELKNSPATSDIPIIFLTSLNESIEEEMGLLLGAVDYVAKPVNPLILLARLRAHLAVKASEELLRGKNVM